MRRILRPLVPRTLFRASSFRTRVTKDIRASSTPIISNTEKDDETLSGDGIKNDEFVFKREEEKEEEKKDEMKATSAAYEADSPERWQER